MEWSHFELWFTACVINCSVSTIPGSCYCTNYQHDVISHTRKLKAYAKSTRTAYRALFQNTNLRYCCHEAFAPCRFETKWAAIVVCKGHWQIPARCAGPLHWTSSLIIAEDSKGMRHKEKRTCSVCLVWKNHPFFSLNMQICSALRKLSNV